MTVVEQTDPVARSTFLIRDASGTKALGTGVLIGPRHVLTCAHVVKDHDQVGLYEHVAADDPLQTVTDMILGDADGSNDLALLRLADEIADRDPLDFTNWQRRPFTVRGFPFAGVAHGYGIVHGRILGEAYRDGWLQIETSGEGTIELGMSGSAVWCERSVAVGIVVYKEADRRAYAIPKGKIRTFLGQFPDSPWTVNEQAHETFYLPRIKKLLASHEMKTVIQHAAEAGDWCDPSRELADALCAPKRVGKMALDLSGAYQALCDEKKTEAADDLFEVAMHAIPAAVYKRMPELLPDGAAKAVQLDEVFQPAAEFQLAASAGGKAEFVVAPTQYGATPRPTHQMVTSPEELGADPDKVEAAKAFVSKVQMQLATEITDQSQSLSAAKALIASFAAVSHRGDGSTLIYREDFDRMRRNPQASTILAAIDKALAQGTSLKRHFYWIPEKGEDDALRAAIRLLLPALMIVEQRPNQVLPPEIDDVVDAVRKMLTLRASNKRTQAKRLSE